MHTIQIDHLTPHQVRQMKKGSKIRIRKGKGLNLTVNPSTYNIVARAFNRDSGAQLNMSPEQISELMMQVAPQRLQQYDTTGTPIENNVDVGPTPMQRQRAPQPVPPAPDMHLHPAGRGIFGSHFDKILGKNKKKVYQIGDVFKPLAKAGISAGISALSASAIAMQPELSPFITMGGMATNAVAHDYLDHPARYQGFSGVKHPHKANNLPQQVEQMKHYEKMNDELGTNFDYMGKAGLGKASANEATAKMNEMSIKARPDLSMSKFEPEYKMSGGNIHHRNDRTVMGKGVRLSESHNTQALQSQPMNENFSMNHMLPPSFQVHKVGDHHMSGSGFNDDEEEYDSDEDFEDQHPTTKAMILAEKAKEAKELRDRLRLLRDRTHKEPEESDEEYDSDEDFKDQHPTTKAMILAEKAKEAKELRDRLKLMKERTQSPRSPRPERQTELIQISQPHNYYQKGGFSPSVMIPPSYMSQAEDANFIRKHTKGKKGNGLYASGKAGHGLYS